MIDKKTAREIVRKYVNQYFHVAGDQMAILDDETLDRPYGWVFFYCSQKFLETQDPRYMVGGNTPILVRSTDASLHSLGTALPVDQSLLQLERRLGLV